MSDIKISQLPYIGKTGYTATDIIPFVNYINPTGTTSETKIDDLKDYILTGVVKGSGTVNYLPKWTGTTGLGNSQIQDDGTYVLIDTSTALYGLQVYNSIPSTGGVGIRTKSDSGVGDQTGLFAYGAGNKISGTSVGVYGFAFDGLVAIGVKGDVGPSEFGSVTTGIGGYFDGRGDGAYGYPSSSYSVQLKDGTEGLNKVLVSATADGKSNCSSDLTGLTSVSATTISANTVVISGTTVNPKQTIALFFGHDSLSPADTQTYYIGNDINLAAIISGSDGRRVIMPKTGQIVAMDICLNIGGVNGSSESSTFTINNVTQSTQSSITSSYVYTASSANIFYTLSSPLPVTVGDKIEIRWATPVWVTNPTSVRQQMNVYLQY